MLKSRKIIKSKTAKNKLTKHFIKMQTITMMAVWEEVLLEIITSVKNNASEIM